MEQVTLTKEILAIFAKCEKDYANAHTPITMHYHFKTKKKKAKYKIKKSNKGYTIVL